MDPRVWLCLCLGLLGCGEEGDDDFYSQQSEIEVQGDYSCCLNGSYYECGSSEAVVDCIDGDVSGCSSAGDC